MAQLSADGTKIEGIKFPNPDPDGTIFGQGSTTFPYSIRRDQIVAIEESWDDDAMGMGHPLRRCTRIWIGATGFMILAYEDYEEIHALWNQ